jgi:phosphonate transport system ATP-binding protein
VIDRVLRLHGASVTYPGDRRALAHVDLEVEPGEFLVLLGPSGAGKSTLLRCLNGLVPMTEGTLVAGPLGVVRGAVALRAFRKRTGMVFQQHQLIGRLTALANVLTGRLGYHSPWRTLLPLPRADKVIALHALDRVGLLDRALHRVDQFSGGEQQRVGVARALAQEPRLLVMDEPTASLDFGNQVRVLEKISALAATGIGILFSSHDPDHAFLCAHRALLLGQGRALELGPPREVIRSDSLQQLYGVSVQVVPLEDGRHTCLPSIGH